MISQKSFHATTDEADLTVSLSDRSTLIITLADFADEAVYVNEYTKEDVGVQIHRKTDLFNLYSSFTQSSARTGRECPANLDELGQINEGSPSYRIEKGGKITIFQCTFDSLTEKKLVYESRLSLLKLRNLSEAETAMKKLATKERKMREHFLN